MQFNTQRAFASLEKKISESVGHRVDLELADMKKINKSTGHFLLAYASKVPTSDELADFFIRKFNAKITPFLSTAKVYDAQKVVTVVAQLLNITRDFEDIDKRKMVPVIAGYTYLDVPLDECWEVTERAGKKVLVKKIKDDIGSLVQARREAMMDSSPTKTFAKLSQTVSGSLLKWLSLIEKSDRVRALVDDKVVEGEVMAVTDSEVKLKYEGGNVSLPRQAVIEVLERGKERDEARQEYAEKYFTDAYGSPDYAKRLTR